MYDFERVRTQVQVRSSVRDRKARKAKKKNIRSDKFCTNTYTQYV